MPSRPAGRQISPDVWALVLVLSIVAILVIAAGMFTGMFNSYVPVTVTSARAGLVMDSGAKVKMRGVQVGRVAGIDGGAPVRLKLELFPDRVDHIPANVQAEILATTAFGAKYVDLVVPEHPRPQRISAGG